MKIKKTATIKLDNKVKGSRAILPIAKMCLECQKETGLLRQVYES